MQILLISAAATAAFTSSRSAAGGRLLLAGMIIAVIGGSAVVRYPRAAAVVLLGLTSTVFLKPVLPLGAAGVRSDVAELLAFALIGAWALRRLLDPTSVSPQPFVLPLVLLLVALAVGVMVGLTAGAETPQVLGNVKTYGLYALVLPFAGFFGSQEQKARLERWVVAVATAGSTLVLLAIASGYQLDGRPGTITDVNSALQTQRLRPAVMPLLFLATLILVGRLSLHGATLLRVLTLMLYATIWLITFNRSTCAALTLVIALLLLFRRGPRRPKRSLATVVVLLLLVPLAYATAASGRTGRTAQAVSMRLATIGQAQTLRSSSFEDRRKEYAEAGAALARRPVTGVGVGAPYGARRATYDANRGYLVYRERLFHHNSWVFLYLHLGLLGAAGIVALSVRVTRESWRSVTTGDLDDSARAAAAAFALLGLGLEATLNPNLLARPSIIAFCLCLTLLASPRASQRESA